MKSTNDNINTHAASDPRIVALRKHVDGILAPRIALVFEAMTEHLFNLSASEKLGAKERARNFEAFSTLKTRSKPLIEEMMQRLDSAYNRLAQADQKNNALEKRGTDLDLVDLNEFESSLAIKRMAQLGSDRYWVALEALTLRVAKIIDADPKIVRLPFGLFTLCRAYRNTMTSVAFAPDILSELDRSFVRNLLAEIGVVYDDINQHLADQGILPGIEQEIEATGSKLTPKVERAKPRSNPQTMAASGDKTDNQSQFNHPKLQNSAETGTQGSAGSTENIVSFPGKAPDATAFAPSPLAHVAAQMGNQNFLPGQGDQVSHTTLTRGTLERLRSGNTGASAEDLRAYESSPEYIAYKAKLESQIQALRQHTLGSEPDTSSLAAQLGLTEGDPQTAALNGSVQLVDSLYRTIGRVLPDNEKLGQSLHALKLPLAELSLKEPDFYLDREHPARQLVERLSEVGALAPQNNPRIQQQIEAVLSEVNAQYQGDVAVFNTALETVTAIALTVLRQQQRNIQRQIATEEGKEKREQARRTAELALASRLPQQSLPAILLDLIESLLHDELTRRLLRTGEEQDYNAILDLTTSLNQTLLGLTSDGTPLEPDTASQWTAALGAYLDNGQLLLPEQDELLERLRQELSGAQPVKLRDSTLSGHARFPEPEFSRRVDQLPRLKRWIKRARDLKVGAWLVDKSEHGSNNHLQLIWRNDSATQFTFTNQQGKKVTDLNLIQLARMLSRRWRPLLPEEQLSVIERSVFTTLEDKQRGLVSATLPSVSEELSRNQLIDETQSMMRRARRQGTSHCAMTLETTAESGSGSVIDALAEAGLEITGQGQLSSTVRGLLIQTKTPELIQAAVTNGPEDLSGFDIRIAPIDSSLGSAEALWSAIGGGASGRSQRSTRDPILTKPDARPANLPLVVHDIYTGLQQDMPPRLSLQRIVRSAPSTQQPLEQAYQVLLDGTAASSGELGRRSSYHAIALAIALDCHKVNRVCRFAESIEKAGRETPSLVIHVTAEAAAHNEFLDFVLHEISESGIGTSRLKIELSDSMRIRDESRIADFTNTLRSIGCQVGIDNVNPNRGSTGELQKLRPHTITLDPDLWPPDTSVPEMASLHQVISDLHHLVGEHVVIRDSQEPGHANQLGIDLMEVVEEDELDTDTLLQLLPVVRR